MVNPVTAALLDGYLGKNIDKICENNYANAADNHCAHFVSHVLGLTAQTMCGDLLTWPQQQKLGRQTRGTGGATRCNELYNRLPQRGAWPPAAGLNTNGMLLFATPTSNMSGDQMGNHPRKHVGIIFSGQVYNYGNTEDKVRKEPTVEAFRTRMAGAYHDPAIGLYYAVPQ